MGLLIFFGCIIAVAAYRIVSHHNSEHDKIERENRDN